MQNIISSIVFKYSQPIGPVRHEKGHLYLRQQEGYYDPIQSSKVIPALYQLWEQPPANKAAAAARWCSQFGTVSNTVDGFWEFVEQIGPLWDMLLQCKGMRLEEVSTWVQPYSLDHYDPAFHEGYKTTFVLRDKNGAAFEVGGTPVLKDSIEDLEKSGLLEGWLLRAGTAIVINKVLAAAGSSGRLTIRPGAYYVDSSLPDRFEMCVTPVYVPDSLRSALWFNFLRLISSGDRVCPVCNTVFSTTQRLGRRKARNDKKYCSPTCQNTGKSRKKRKPQQYKQ